MLNDAQINPLISIYFPVFIKTRCSRIRASNIYVFCLALQIAVASVTTHAQEGASYKWCILSEVNSDPQ